MSEMGNHVVGIMESADYQFGWESAERGEPLPDWLAPFHDQQERLRAQRMGWNNFHESGRAP